MKLVRAEGSFRRREVMTRVVKAGPRGQSENASQSRPVTYGNGAPSQWSAAESFTFQPPAILGPRHRGALG
jgi:hypothetical protein